MKKTSLISQFLDITATETTATARHFLEATNWNLEEAILLFYTTNEARQHLPCHPSNHKDDLPCHPSNNEDEVRPPLPVKRDTLYHDSHTWQRDSVSGDNLAMMFPPPRHLMFNGTFEEAKVAALRADRWLLVNIQSVSEFASHVLNCDTWSNQVVSATVGGNFVFWQEYDDTIKGRKVCTFYKVGSVPAVLLIDPVTGQKMRSWFGAIEPEGLLEDLVSFMDRSPNDNLRTLLGKKNCEEVETAADEEWLREYLPLPEDSEPQYLSLPEDSEPQYPHLPEEPSGDRSLLCRVAVRFPDGQRIQRNFMKTDPIQLLWSFCYWKLEESEKQKPFSLINAVPRALTSLDYEKAVTFEESGIANSLITVAW